VSAKNIYLVIKDFNVKDYLKIARFDHWIKQLFILPGFFLAYILVGTGEPAVNIAVTVFLGLLAASLAASANYCINEWLDADFDKYHPVKKNRPFITGSLKPGIVLTEYAVFIILSLATAFFVSYEVLISVAALLLMGVFYNVRPIRLKDLPYIDILSESLNNAIRLIIGWFCITTLYLPPASIVFGYWMGGAFLMAAKRFAEYRMIGDPEQARLYRKSFGRYSELSLLLSTVFYGFLSIFFCGIYLIKHRIELLIFIPFLCGLFCYYLGICFKTDSAAQKPEKLYREKGLLIYTAFLFIMFIALHFIDIPIMESLLDVNLIRWAG